MFSGLQEQFNKIVEEMESFKTNAGIAIEKGRASASKESRAFSLSLTNLFKGWRSATIAAEKAGAAKKKAEKDAATPAA